MRNGEDSAALPNFPGRWWRNSLHGTLFEPEIPALLR